MTTTAMQKEERRNLQRVKEDREKAFASLSKQPKMSSAEAVANYNRRQARDQQTREAV